jgi:FkbM family methyltransferase
VKEREAAIADREAVLRARSESLADMDRLQKARELASSSRAGVGRALEERQAQNAALLSTVGMPTDRGDPALAGRYAAEFRRLTTPATEDDAAALAEWAAIAERHRGYGLRGGQQLIDAYIVERYLDGSPIKILIATQEGRTWYDRVDPTEIPSCRALAMIRPGDTVFDCGANNGVNTLGYAQTVGPTGRVLAFDPFPLNIDIVRFNAKLNRRDNIEAHPVGLSNRRAETTVSIAEQCITSLDTQAPDQVAIRLERLDAYAHLRPSFLKIDIEGAEVDALEGASEILSQQPSLFIELHPTFLPRFGRSMMDIFRYIDPEVYAVHLDYPGLPPLFAYEYEFDLVEYCHLYVVPRSRPALRRYFTP